MISTTDLTGTQLEQLEALLADTTLGGGLYRPPVARDESTLTDLESTGLVRWTEECGFEITDAGKVFVAGRAKDIADSQAYIMYSPDDELVTAIDALKAEADGLTDDAGMRDLREQILSDIEACQNELDRRAEAGTPVEGRAERSGRHHVVPADDRPTAALPRVEDDTAPLPFTGTLPGLPVVDVPCDPDEQATVRLIAAIRATPSPEELAELAAVSTAGWQALEADLGDERSWWRRNLTPRRVLVLSVIASIVVTWFAAWLVMA